LSFFFDAIDGNESFRVGLHGGMGTNTLCHEFLEKYNLPYSLRDDYINSMNRLNEETVDIFLGNHMQHNDTIGKAKRIETGDKYAFVNPDEWKPYNIWCIENLERLREREKEV